jgi:hypothetical protein
MTHRERAMAVLEGRTPDCAPMLPDLSEWFRVRREEGTLPERYRSMDLMALHRDLDAGCPVHVYTDFYEIVRHRVEPVTRREGDEQITEFHTPVGDLRSVKRRTDSSYGTYFHVEHFVKRVEDLRILEFIFADQTYVPRCAGAQAVFDRLGEWGVADLVIPRSPLPMLLNNDYLAMTDGILMLVDYPAECERFMRAIEEVQTNFFHLLGRCPGRLVIFGDNVDNVIVSPTLFRRYSLPYYQRRCEVLHRYGKIVSLHVDGRLRGIMPVLKDTGLDVLDGLTPAPMNDYEVEELAAAIGERLRVWCGVPATLFCENIASDEAIRAYARRILDTFGPRVILNVGDQLPPNADLEKVRLLADAAADRCF